MHINKARLANESMEAMMGNNLQNPRSLIAISHILSSIFVVDILKFSLKLRLLTLSDVLSSGIPETFSFRLLQTVFILIVASSLIKAPPLFDRGYSMNEIGYFMFKVVWSITFALIVIITTFQVLYIIFPVSLSCTLSSFTVVLQSMA